MKISIGTNYFGEYDRQTRARESLEFIKNKYKEMINLYCVQYESDQLNYSENFKILRKLKRSSKDIILNSKKNIPFLTDIFDILSNTESDYFIFANSDIILRYNLIKHIIEFKPDAMSCNRLDIHPITNLNQPLIPHRWEIGGFDVFVFKNEWYQKNKKHFTDYLLGCPWFDHQYAGTIRLLVNSLLGNSYPPFALHELHEKKWSYDTPEATFNATQFNNDPNRWKSGPWDEYFASYLRIKRQNGYVLNKDQEEIEKETEFFNQALTRLKDKI